MPSLEQLHIALGNRRLRVDDDDSILAGLVQRMNPFAPNLVQSFDILPRLRHLDLIDVKFGNLGLDPIACVLKNRVLEGRKPLEKVSMHCSGKLSADALQYAQNQAMLYLHGLAIEVTLC
jgi:hypothetical protein